MSLAIDTLLAEDISKVNESLLHQDKYSIEFFHIYTDETIDTADKSSIDFLRSMLDVVELNHDLIVMIDDYNPTRHTLKTDEVVRYLSSQSFAPKFVAFESDLIANADKLLAGLHRKTSRNYANYIQSKGKYPCSLLTATWYLTRLGVFDTSIIRGVSESKKQDYVGADRLINILPYTYREIETRALGLISGSEYSSHAHKIQDFFTNTPSDKHSKYELF